MTLIKVANCTFVHLLRYLKTSFDILCFALITEVAHTTIILQVLKQNFRKIFCVLLSCWLKCTVNLTITTNRRDVTLQAVTSMDILEHLILIDKSWILIINNDFEAKIGLLPYQ